MALASLLYIFNAKNKHQKLAGMFFVCGKDINPEKAADVYLHILLGRATNVNWPLKFHASSLYQKQL